MMVQFKRRVRFETLVGLGIGAIVAAPAILVAIMSGGAGHGAYVAARALFPFAMLLSGFEGSVGPAAVGAGLLQFPLYGALTGKALALKNYQAVRYAAAVHLVAAVACFSGALRYLS